MATIRPAMIVALGATAAYALFGPAFRLMQERGKVRTHTAAPWAMATVHPSALLRIPEAADRRAARAQFLKELRQVAADRKGEAEARVGRHGTVICPDGDASN